MKELLIKKIEQVYDLKWSEIIIKNNKQTDRELMRKKIRAQQIYSYLCLRELNQGCADTGRDLNKHHSTILYSLKLITDRLYIKDCYTTEVVNILKSHLQENKFQ